MPGISASSSARGRGDRLEAVGGEGLAVRPDGRGRHRQFAAWLEGLVRDAPDMPELEHDAAAGDMDRAGHALPAFDLLGAVDARRRDIALALRRHLRRFRDDQPCARALRVIERVERGRHVAFGGAAPRQGRHGDAVGQRERPDIDGREQVRRGLGRAVLHGGLQWRGGRGLRRFCLTETVPVHCAGCQRNAILAIAELVARFAAELVSSV